jgi:hydroxylamine reductase
MKKITKDMSFADILNKYPKAGEILMGEGLHCIGCPMAMMETLEEGCKAHGLDPDKIVKKLNKEIGK